MRFAVGPKAMGVIRHAWRGREGVRAGTAIPELFVLTFRGFSGGKSLEQISWDEWFDAFEENNLALLIGNNPKKLDSTNS